MKTYQLKNLLIILGVLLLSVSCGKKTEVSKAKFKIFSGNAYDSASPLSTFTGGLLIMGKSADGQQTFIIPYQPGLELELKKGDWEFGTIGWMQDGGGYPIEGNQQCSFQAVPITSDVFTVNFSMNKQNCLNLTSFEGNKFTDPIFYNFMGGTYSGFKKLQVKTCANLSNNCSTQNIPGSFRVSIPVLLKGVSATSVGSGLVSRCISGTEVSSITPPYGGAAGGFIGVKIMTFTNSTCDESNAGAKSYYFPHGFGEVLNATYVENSVTITKRGTLSVDIASADASLALDTVVFKGDYAIPTGLPTHSAQHDLYIYSGSTMLVQSPYPTAGKYLYYNGSGWTAFLETGSVKLLLQD